MVINRRNYGREGINDKFLGQPESDGEVPMGTAKNKPLQHPRWQSYKGKGERFKAWRNGRKRPTKQLSKASQFYYTKDRNPDGSQKIKLDGQTS